MLFQGLTEISPQCCIRTSLTVTLELQPWAECASSDLARCKQYSPGLPHAHLLSVCRVSLHVCVKFLVHLHLSVFWSLFVLLSSPTPPLHWACPGNI